MNTQDRTDRPSEQPASSAGDVQTVPELLVVINQLRMALIDARSELRILGQDLAEIESWRRRCPSALLDPETLKTIDDAIEAADEAL